MGKLKKAGVLGGAGALIAYLFDPQMGRTRRAKLQDQLGGIFRRGTREVERKAEYAKGQIEGARHIGSSDSPPASDETLTAKIESEVLTHLKYPKGSININTVGGVVELRGQCDSQDQIDELERRAGKVTGVIEVRNFLHLPGEPAPNKVDALRT